MARTNVTVRDTDLGWRQMMRAASKRPVNITIGVHDTDANRTGDGDSIDNVSLMTIHEFGTDEIPERSVIRSAWDENLRTYKKMVIGFWGHIVELGTTRDKSVEVIGRKVLSDFVTKLQDGPHASLALSTVTAKGHSQPLIDTYQLADSFEYEVRPA